MVVRKAFENQVVNTMRIVKKLRSTHRENKQLKALVFIERESAKLRRQQEQRS